MKKVILIASLFLMCNFCSAQQAMKLGHISSADLFQAMPEMKGADSVLTAYQKSLTDEYNSMVAEYKQKTDDYNTNMKTMTDAVKEVKEQEISDLENRIQSFQQDAQDKLTQKKQDLYTPILKKAQDAIKAVARENGYTYVFDTAGGAVVAYPDGDDLLALVKKYMNLK
jgi:outer membrane protein